MMAFLSWQTKDTLGSSLLDLFPNQLQEFQPPFSRLSFDSVLIKMMYGCGFFRRGGIDGGTLITINRVRDIKQNHTLVKVLFLLSAHQPDSGVYTGVCVCGGGAREREREKEEETYVHIWCWINIADEQYSNKCQDIWLINQAKYLLQLHKGCKSSGRKASSVLLLVLLLFIYWQKWLLTG